MRYLIVVLLGFLCLTGCKKESSRTYPASPLTVAQISPVKKYLRDSLPRAVYDSLEFDRVIVSSLDTGRSYFIRVPYQGIDAPWKFALLRTDGHFLPMRAALIQITQNSLPSGTIPTIFSFSGSICKSSLSGTLEYQSVINNGFIQALHGKIAANEAAKEPVELPEIIIYAPDETYYADWLVISGSGGGGIGYSSSAPLTGSGGGGASSASPVTNSNSFNVADELQASKPAISLARFLACFTTVPSTGATYSASLMVSIPNPSNPSQMWNPLTGRVGHTFIRLTKTNGSNTVTQYIGFYAACGVCALAGDPTTSKMVDNSGHPYNASLTLNLDEAQFGAVTSAMQYHSADDYALCDYNCTAYALDVFNTVMPTALDPALMTIPGGTPGEMPNGLYLLFQHLQTGPSAPDIKLYLSPQTAGASHGACN